MIHELTMKNWVKHHNRTFNFQEGMNLIRGDNEMGKSLILEAADFALHGSVALRLPVSMYPTTLQSDLTVTIRGEQYKIVRSLKKAQLFKGEELLASGTKPVDAEVRKLLGYNRNVFMVSNYSSQDAIQYLSQMKPAERKRTIDNVVGLTAVEQVLAERKAELSLLRRTQGNLQASEVSAPETPSSELNLNIVKDIEDAQENIRKYSSMVTTQLSNQRQHEALDATKPARFELLPEDGWFDYSEDQIVSRRVTKTQLENKITKLETDCALLNNNPVQEPKQPDLSGLIEGLTADKIAKGKADREDIQRNISFIESELNKLPDISGETYVPVSEIEKVTAHEKLYQDWLAVQDLKERGSIQCNHCNGEVLLAIEHIRKHYAHVPESVSKPEQDSQSLINKNKDLEFITEKQEALKKQLESFQNQLADFDLQWYSAVSLENHVAAEERKRIFEDEKSSWTLWISDKREVDSKIIEAKDEYEKFILSVPTDEELEKLTIAKKNKAINEKNVALLNQWEKSKNALEPFNAALLASAKTDLALVTQKEERLRAEKNEWDNYHSKLSTYSVWKAQMNEADLAVENEKLAIETLNNFKAKIKTTILPSVNSVASTWMNRMSEGKHSKVTLTDDMEILVGDMPIEALSISGRALGHLSLRMALGQVLTNSVFPVFMADEVDASMRNNRAQNVLDSLTDMLSGSMKQIIMISHRELERIDNVIEV